MHLGLWRVSLNIVLLGGIWLSGVAQNLQSRLGDRLWLILPPMFALGCIVVGGVNSVFARITATGVESWSARISSSVQKSLMGFVGAAIVLASQLLIRDRRWILLAGMILVAVALLTSRSRLGPGLLATGLLVAGMWLADLPPAVTPDRGTPAYIVWWAMALTAWCAIVDVVLGRRMPATVEALRANASWFCVPVTRGQGA